jgi:hypothetical protein
MPGQDTVKAWKGAESGEGADVQAPMPASFGEEMTRNLNISSQVVVTYHAQRSHRWIVNT